MFEWSEEQLAIRDAVRRFVEEEVKPNVEELEHGDTPPYEVIRKLYRTFGLDALARDGFKRQLERKLSSTPAPRSARRAGERGDDPDPHHRAVPLLPRHRDRLGREHRTGRRHHHEGRHPGPDGAVGTRPAHPGEDRRLGHHRAQLGLRRLGGMTSTARRDGEEYILNGNKTFITNGPYADTIVFYAKLDDGSDTPLRQRPVLTFILDKGMPGLEQSKPFRKMGLHSSPTGELFLTDVRVGKDRLLGETEGKPGGGKAARAPRATSSPSGPGWPPCHSA
jgi:hypothetical protein